MNGNVDPNDYRQNRTPLSLFNEQLDFPYCEDVDNYLRLAKIGQGTFG